jgi:hypothetical protein
MLWLKHGDQVLFRSSRCQAFEPGTWDAIRVPNGINDQFDYRVSAPGITFEGDLCDPTLPGTYAGRPAFCLVKPQEYREQ